MARRSALPGGALDKLMEESRPLHQQAAAPRAAKRKSASRLASKVGKIHVTTTRPAVPHTDPVVRYAASRGLVLAAGPLESVRLAMQLAMDVREVARKEHVGVVTVVTRALAGYLHDR